MWIIEKIGLVKSDRNVLYSPSYVISEEINGHIDVELTLYETTSGVREVVETDPSRKAFFRQINYRRPYGFVNMDDCSDKVDIDDYFIVIDSMSLKFLDLVEDVEEIHITTHDKFAEFIKQLPSGFMNIDQDLSLFSIDDCPCTLLNAMCYRPNGWYGDEFYISSTKLVDWHKDNVGLDYVYSVFKVTFCDVERAKRLHTKAVVAGRAGVVKRTGW